MRLTPLFFALILIVSTPVAASSTAGDFKIACNNMLCTASAYAVTYSIPDPKVRGVTCFVTTVEIKGLSLQSDPSNTSVACRQTEKMFKEDTTKVAQGKEGELVFNKSKSGLNKTLLNLFKTFKLRRTWDAHTGTYIYTTYVTKLIEGSYKVSTSAVTTYGAF